MPAHTDITRRVLVVCSRAANSQVIENAIRNWMFDTVVCSSVREAEDLLAKRDFALVFCEDHFKEGTYVGLLSVFGQHSKVPIVVMISDGDQDFVFREAMALGALGVIPNPCSAKDVQWMVIRATQHGVVRS